MDPTPPSLHNIVEGDVDRMVRESFFPGEGAGRIFVDVGAASPDFLSISALYRSAGWRVVAIEPNPAFCDMHRKRGHEIYQYACADRDEDNVDFCVVDSHGAEYENGRVTYESFSSLAIKDAYAALRRDLDIQRIKVNLRRLDTIFRDHLPEVAHIDILSVDVEGWELEVLGGLNVAAFRPGVMIIENLFADGRYGDYLRGLGYSPWRRMHPNDIYVRDGLLPPLL